MGKLGMPKPYKHPRVYPVSRSQTLTLNTGELVTFGYWVCCCTVSKSVGNIK